MPCRQEEDLMNRLIAAFALALLLLPATGWAAAIRLDRYVRDYAGQPLDGDSIAKFTTSNRPAPVTTPSPCYALPLNDRDDLEPRVSDSRPANCTCTVQATNSATTTSDANSNSADAQANPCAAAEDDEDGGGQKNGAADLLEAATGFLFDGFDFDYDNSPATNFLSFGNFGLSGPGLSGGGFGGFAGFGAPGGFSGVGASGGSGAGGSSTGLMSGGPSIDLTNPTLGPGFPQIGPVELPPGTYVFSFDVSNEGTSTETIVVTVFGSSSNYVSVEVTVPGGSGPTSHTVPFVVIGPDVVDFDFQSGGNDEDEDENGLPDGRTSLPEEIAAVPEPGTFALLGVGLLIAARRLRRR
jgi:hypothetical protein